jgi:CGNR zinc finger
VILETENVRKIVRLDSRTVRREKALSSQPTDSGAMTGPTPKKPPPIRVGTAVTLSALFDVGVGFFREFQPVRTTFCNDNPFLHHPPVADIANSRSVSSQRLSALNSALEQAPGLLRVHKHSDRIEREWTSAADGLRKVLFTVLASAAELLASDRLGRIRECGPADCTWLFVDQSRNRSRRWCDMTACGNRMKARRHYQRAKPHSKLRAPGSNAHLI